MATCVGWRFAGREMRGARPGDVTKLVVVFTCDILDGFLRDVTKLVCRSAEGSGRGSDSGQNQDDGWGLG
jgi:hypothetical protein